MVGSSFQGDTPARGTPGSRAPAANALGSPPPPPAAIGAPAAAEPQTFEQIGILFANLAAAHPLARLKAIHELGRLLREQVDEWVDRAELEQVRAARTMRPQPSWQKIGRALGVSHTQARRRFADRL